jgi:hypothetical protein
LFYRKPSDKKPVQITYSKECIRPLMPLPESVSVTSEEDGKIFNSKAAEIDVK